MSRRNTGPGTATRELVMERDRYRCVRCGLLISGEPGVGYSLQHRVPRGMGGSKDPRLKLPSNLVLLCGSGTTQCHGDVESNRTAAMAYGYLVSRHLDPAEVPVTVTLIADDGFGPVTARFLLDDEGGRFEVEEVRLG